MQIFTWNTVLTFLNNGKESSFFKNGCGISVGSFDGLHCGHRFLLETLNISCKNQNIPSGVFTFSRPLPSIKHSKDYKGDISTLSQRIKLFESIGLDFIITADFDETFASMLGTDFFTILANVCNLKVVAEGIDFRCGYKGVMDIQALKYFCERISIQTIFAEPVFYDSANAQIYTQQTENFQKIIQNNSVERVSSSLIRKLIQRGFFSTAEILLSRKFSLELCNNIQNKQTEFEIKNIKQVLPPPGKYHCKTENQSDIQVEITNEKVILKKPAATVIF